MIVLNRFLPQLIALFEKVFILLENKIECRLFENFILFLFEELHTHALLIEVDRSQQVLLFNIQFFLLSIFSQSFEQQISL